MKKLALLLAALLIVKALWRYVNPFDVKIEMKRSK